MKIEPISAYRRYIPTLGGVAMSSMSAREFNQDVSAAKRAAAEGPVVITDRGEDAFVLLSIDEYRRLKADSQDLVSRLSMDDEIEFEPAPLQVDLRVADL
ncbi:type II toxin-antitoxin system Phd/YefM family antitoxin [Nocardia sp. NPDC127606]